MSVPFGYQVYGLYVSREKVEERAEIVHKLAAQLAGMGLHVEKFRSKSGETIRFRVFHPKRAIDYDEAETIDDLYSLCGGGTLGFGFLGQVAPPDSEEWVKEYEFIDVVGVEIDGIISAMPDKPDGVPSQAELIAATLAADLNEKFIYTGEQINKMQVDAMVRNIERIQRMKKSGKFRIVSVDTWDYAEIVKDFNTEEDALLYICLMIARFPTLASDMAGRMRRAMEELQKGKRDEELISEIIPNEVNTNKLRKHLEENPVRPEFKVIYLYDPEGNFIGRWAV